MAKESTSQGSVAAERPVGRVKTKEKSEPGFVKRKKRTKGQASLPAHTYFTVDDLSLAEVKKEKKGKQVDVIVIDTDEESVDGSGEQKEKRKRKRKSVTESLNGSCVKNGKDKEVSKKKKKKQLETAPLSSVKKMEKKPRTVKKIKAQNGTPEREQEAEHTGKDELPKKAKKRKNILVVNAEEIEEQVKEKKKKKTTSVKITEGICIAKMRKSAQMEVTKNGVKLGTPERETCEVEEVKVKKKKKKVVAKEDKKLLATPQMKGNNKRSKAASGQKVEKDNMLNKKDKSTESEIVIIDEEETELKMKVKRRKVSVAVSKVEQKERKKRKMVNSKGEKEVPLLLDCEEVEEQCSETVVPGQKKKICVKGETVSFGTDAKRRQIKDEAEAEDQHESPLVDVVFLSAKTGNTDEVNINQERRQALQMDIDEASRPKETTGLGQWTTAQFDSSAQQQKFLRLMGGFKKGSQMAAGSSEGANMALGKNAQQQLQQGLLGEFERAQSRRMDFSNRGSGLGFSAPVINKKFSIDVNACRSVRFDD
ncbi:lysine-rich nucleolar protein 1 [Cyclopterus lumpus]|nr:lysine-rich nucleolar protein 1 [Cyclopterus lumpus]XP_034400471.1 lysine-rich nucleolar protein 1 [Cyclopterus lumpus]XP_034400478.1 lysine-rich nucleolar protein 1 [Cyclopterus lumpus]